jgi:ABC-type polar amino acid transport system ATPase subunit
MSLIKGSQLWVSFDGGKSAAVSAATFCIERAETTLFLGSSGSGKTTLLKVMAGLILPSRGELEKCKESRIGYVSQGYDLFPHLSVFANCSHPQRIVLRRAAQCAKQKAMEQLERLGIAELANRLPAQLSGGQKQKVAIARALSMDATILLLDEPTASLDPVSVGNLAETLQELQRRETTLVISTHDLLFARAMQGRVYRLEKGIIVDSPIEKIPIQVADAREARKTVPFEPPNL